MTTIGYNEPQDLVDYALARGVTIDLADAPVLLTRALDWLELRPFKGIKTDPEQPLEFPRNGSDTVPEKIKTAQLVAAMIYADGGDPMAPVGQRVLAERVDGAVSVQYSDKGNAATLYPQLSALLRDYLSNAGGMQFTVSKG